MDNQIAPPLKKERNAKLIEISEKVSMEFKLKMAGSHQRVLVEEPAFVCDCQNVRNHILRPDEVLWKGHTSNFMCVYFAAPKDIDLSNTFVDVKIGAPYEDGVFARKE